MPNSVDVVVVGGGPAGAVMALALGRGGAKVRLLEGRAEPAWKVGETLAPGGRSALQGLGIWEKFRRGGHLPSHGNRSCWGGESLLEKDFIFNREGCGWQLDRRQFEALLLQEAAAMGAEVRMGVSLTRIRRTGAGWTVETSDGICHADLLVDASGRSAVIARALGVKRLASDRLVSLYAVATATSESDRDTRLLLETLPDGWFYSALTPGGKRTVAYQTDADLLAGSEWRDPSWFRRQLGKTRHLAALLEAHGHGFESAPRLTSAHSGRLERWGGEGWFAVGDAAMSFDPLSGQGILQAMQSAHSTAAVLLDVGASSREALWRWNEQVWEAYLKSRQDYYAMERRWLTQPFWQRRLFAEPLTREGTRSVELIPGAGRVS